MQAIVRHKYGSPDVLRLEEGEKPVPRANEVLIKVHAATVTAGDCEVRRFDIAPLFWLPVRLVMGITRPRIKILGQELAGEIESVGAEVSAFSIGDAVVAPTTMNMGAYAEYVCLPSTAPMAVKPAGLSYQDAATIPTGGLNALYFLRKATIQPGEKVLINGAGGSIGTYAVQIAKSLGAEVTGVDSTAKLDMLRSLGADHVVDYTREDFTTNDLLYDVILEVAGVATYSQCSRSLTRGGRFISTNPKLSEIFGGMWVSRTSHTKLLTGLAPYNSDDLEYLLERMESGELRAVIDTVYPLDRTADAHRYVESGAKRGNVVIAIDHTPD